MLTTLTTSRLVLAELGRSYPSSDRNGLQQFARRLGQWLEDASVKAVVIDASRTEAAGASLLGVLVRAHRLAQSAGKEFLIAGASGQLLEILKLAKLQRVLKLVTSSKDVLVERLDMKVIRAAG